MLAAAVAVAIAFWGPPPCATVAVHVVELEPPLAGLATVYPDGHCHVQVDARRWRFWELCAVLVHEYGHIHGRPHSEDPLDVMYPVISRPADPCRGQRPAQYRRGAVIELHHP